MKNARGFNHEFHGWRLWKHVAEYYLTRRGMMAFTSPEVTALLSLHSDPKWPDVQFGIGPFSMRSMEDMKADPGRGALEDKPGLTINAFYLRPRSRGSVAITSADIAEPIEVDANWWGDPADKAMMIDTLRAMRRLAEQPALAPYIAHEVSPGADVNSDAAIDEALNWLTSPGLHGTGTCRMGVSTADSVIDARLRVHGMKGLRVVDCSSMPTAMSANTNGPAMVLGWRAAEMILEDRDR